MKEFKADRLTVNSNSLSCYKTVEVGAIMKTGLSRCKFA